MKFRPSLFWDVDPKTIDVRKHDKYIIARILDFGRDNEVRWMWRTYSKRLIRAVVTKTRDLRPRTRQLWSDVLKAR